MTFKQLSKEANELGYALVPFSRIKTCYVKQRITLLEEIPQDYVNRIITETLAQELTRKLIEYNKLTTVISKENWKELVRTISVELKIIVPESPK